MTPPSRPGPWGHTLLRTSILPDLLVLGFGLESLWTPVTDLLYPWKKGSTALPHDAHSVDKAKVKAAALAWQEPGVSGWRE
jgi:hypothetical protein